MVVLSLKQATIIVAEALAHAGEIAAVSRTP